MSGENNRVEDSVHAVLNPLPDELRARQAAPAPSLERRPSGSASRSQWVDYVVGLGADRDTVEGASRHWSDAAQGYQRADALTKDQLAELADGLGG